MSVEAPLLPVLRVLAELTALFLPVEVQVGGPRRTLDASLSAAFGSALGVLLQADRVDLLQHHRPHSACRMTASSMPISG